MAGAPALSCPACGGPLRGWRALPGGEPRDARLYELLRCERCGTAVTAGAPPGVEAYETGVYAAAPPRAAGAVRLVQRLVDAQAVRLLRRAGLPRGARVLDAGAGRGRLVEALRRAGFDARGIEPSERGVAAARAAGRPVERGAIESHEDAELDAVLLWHVLEHLEDPAAVRRACGWLRPHGLLLVAVPNAGSWQARIGGDGWLHWDLPRHRTHFTTRGLRTLLRGCGFEPGRGAHFVWEHNPGGMWMALLSRLGMTPGFPFHLLKRNVDARPRDLALLGLGVSLAPAAVGLEALAAAVRRGGTVAQLASRP